MEWLLLLLLFSVLFDSSMEDCTTGVAFTECDDAVAFSRGRPIKLDSYKKLLQFKHGGNIRQIPQGTFSLLPELTTLYLSFNAIEILESGSFDGLHKLDKLIIYNNKIQLLQDGTFRNLTQLKLLDLGANKITTVHNNAFQGLANLEEINLSFNLLELIPQSLGWLEKLRKLDLSNNKLSTIQTSPNVFKNLRALQVLNLQDNQIDEVDMTTVKNLNKLEEINLKNNYLSHLNVTNLSGLNSLNKIHLSINDFSCKTLRNIINDLGLINVEVSRGFSKSSSSINGIAYMLAKGAVLVAFILGILTNVDTSCKLKNDLTLCENIEWAVKTPLKIANSTRKLKLGPPLQELPPRVFVHFPQLETLIINYTLMLKIDPDSFAGLANLRELDLFWNEIPEIPTGLFLYCPQLIYLNLGGNNLETLNGDTVTHLKRLQTLILAQNALTNVPHLRNAGLSELDLGSNRIRAINKRAFNNLPNLIVLNLRGNRINYVQQGAFDGLSALEQLNLERNQLAKLDLHDIQVTLPKLKRIRISINSFECDELKRLVDGFRAIDILVPEGLAEPGPISYHGIFCLID